jgi:hypothetical protein
METTPPCHSAGCGQRAVHSCAICGWRYCGGHLLRASFLGSKVPLHVVLNVCHICLDQAIREQHVQGRDLTQWHKVG